MVRNNTTYCPAFVPASVIYKQDTGSHNYEMLKHEVT